MRYATARSPGVTSGESLGRKRRTDRQKQRFDAVMSSPTA
jgi:hypothetical protein